MVGRTNSTLNGSGFVPDGGTVTPIDDVSVWLKCAGIKDKKYTTVGEVLTDSTTMFLLTSDENAMKYLARSTGFADDLCADETFMTYLGQSPYVDGTVLNSDLWLESICNSSCFESVLNVKVPTMTSNTEPSGTVIYSAELSKYDFYAYYAFAKLSDKNWIAGDGVPQYIGYKFDNPICIKKCVFTSAGSYRVNKYKIQCSNDDINWSDLTETLITENGCGDIFINTNNNFYSYYRILITDVTYVTGTQKQPGLQALQFYGRSQN